VRGKDLDFKTGRAASTDIDSICEVDGNYWSDRLGIKHLANRIRSGHCYIVEVHEQVVGYAICDNAFFGFPFIWLLVVSEKYRRQGVATNLIWYIQSESISEKLFSSTNESNAIAKKLFESLDFERCGSVSNIDDSDPEIFYVKRVKVENIKPIPD